MSEPVDPLPRIAPLAEPLPAGVAGRLAGLLPPGMPAPQLFLTVARDPGLFAQLVDTGWLGPTGLGDRRDLPRSLRELVILRTCVSSGNAYEYNLHVQTISARMGLSEAQIDDVRAPAPDPALWSAAERAAIGLVDALVGRLDVDDAEFAAAAAHFDAARLLSITHLVGLYTGVAMLVALARPAFDRYRGAALRLRDRSAPRPGAGTPSASAP